MKENMDIKQNKDEELSFVDDKEKMRDFKELTKEEFLFSYSYLTEEEYDAKIKVIIYERGIRSCVLKTIIESKGERK